MLIVDIIIFYLQIIVCAHHITSDVLLVILNQLKWEVLSFKLSVLKKTHIWTPFNV